MKNLRWTIFAFALATLIFCIASGSAQAQIGSDEPCCKSQSNSTIIILEIPSADGTVIIIIIEQAPSAPSDPSTPDSTAPTSQIGLVPASVSEPKWC